MIRGGMPAGLTTRDLNERIPIMIHPAIRCPSWNSMKLIFPLLLGAVTLASGCASYGVIGNNPSPEVKSQGSYSIMGFRDRFNAGDTFITLAFSGGGTRAAALSWAVERTA